VRLRGQPDDSGAAPSGEAGCREPHDSGTGQLGEAGCRAAGLPERKPEQAMICSREGGADLQDGPLGQRGVERADLGDRRQAREVLAHVGGGPAVDLGAALQQRDAVGGASGKHDVRPVRAADNPRKVV
jgi:hypothetical protein